MKRLANPYRLLAGLAALVLLAATTWLTPFDRAYIWVAFAIGGFAFFLQIFPIFLGEAEFSLTAMVTLGSGLVLGPTLTAWAVFVGILSAWLVRFLFRPRRPAGKPATLYHALFQIALQIIPLFSALYAFQLDGVFDASKLPSGTIWSHALLPSLTFTGIQFLLQALEYWLDKEERFKLGVFHWFSLLFFFVIPIPILLTAIDIFPEPRLYILYTIFGILVLLSVSLNRVGATKLKLERRLQELSVLNRISRSLSETLELERLLNVLQAQVTEFLKIDNFYVALLDAEKNELWYPIAVKFGERRTWPRRVLEDRLTDRVITSASPIFLPRNANREIARTGMPASEDKLSAWMAVPLISGERCIGCLGVFSVSPKVEFAPSDLDLLLTISGQVSLAIENALLYTSTDQTLGLRVQQLATLEAAGRRLMSSLDSDQLFHLVLEYGVEFTGAEWGVLCTQPSVESDILEVKAWHGYRFSPESPPLMESVTGRALHSQQVINLPDVSLAADFRDRTGGQTRSQLSVPLLYENQAKGVLTLESSKPNGFGPTEQSLVVQLSNYAALALNNAFLYAEVQRRLREQSTLYVVTSHLAASLETDNLIQVILEAIQSAIQPETSAIYLWEEHRRLYQLKLATSATNAPETIQPDFLDRMVPISINVDVLKIPSTDEELNTLFAQNEQSRAIFVPLSTNQQRLGGILLHLPRERVLIGPNLQLLQAVSAQSTIALQNALLFADVFETRERLDVVLNTIQEGILVVDTRGMVVLVNRPVERFTGLTADALLGHRLSTLPQTALATLGLTTMQAGDLIDKLGHGLLIETPRVVLHLEDTKPDRFLERSQIPVLSLDGRAFGAMFVLRDTTEEHHIQQARETITETLVHDLRSPISAVMSAHEILIDALQNEDEKDELVSQALRVARRSTERVFRLVNSLLEIARMQSGEIDLNRQPVDVHALAAEVVNEFALQANEYGIILANDVPTGLPAMLADREKFERVLANLVDNALKFTPSGGRVSITAQIQVEDIKFQVADNGPGIPDEYRESIFDRFTQVPNQPGRKRGSGLGLTFCRLVVEAHHGKIWIEPNTPTGSRFCFSVPVGQALPVEKTLIVEK